MGGRNMRLIAALCGLLLLASVAAAPAADILNIGDVENVGGMSGLQMVLKDPARAPAASSTSPMRSISSFLW